jgi:hypothetical protein
MPRITPCCSQLTPRATVAAHAGAVPQGQYRLRLLSGACLRRTSQAGEPPGSLLQARRGSAAPVGGAAPAGTNPRRRRFWQWHTHARSDFAALARRAMVAAAPRTAEPLAIASAARPQRPPGRSMPVQPLCMLRRVQGSRCTIVRRRAETWRQGPAAQLATAAQVIRRPRVT